MQMALRNPDSLRKLLQPNLSPFPRIRLYDLASSLHSINLWLELRQLRFAALAGAISGCGGLGSGIVEDDVGTSGQARDAVWPAVDVGGDYAVDERGVG